MSEARFDRLLAALAAVALLLGAAARVWDVHRPADWRALNGWREADYAQMARAFWREDANPLHPRVDWRGDTSGLVESELPVLPWVAGVLYRAVGEREWILRAIPALASLAALLFFFRLARDALPARAARFAGAAFAANGLLVYLATAIQSEALLVLAEVLAASALWRWWRRGDASAPIAAAAWTAVAVLVKGSAAHLGLLLAWFTWRRHGRRALAMPSVWAAAALAAVPPALWYAWAFHLYRETGLSLGLSNETHWLSLEVLRQPRNLVLGNLESELREVFAGVGVLLAIVGLRAPRERLELPAVWYGSAVLFYVAAGDTAGDGWAWYYHSLSLPAACLLMGLGVDVLAGSRRAAARPLALALALATLLATGARGARLVERRDHHAPRQEAWRCFRALAVHVPPEGRILVRGGHATDAHGHPVAYNASEAFHWMDRRGWNYAFGDFSLDRIEAFAERGARYWLAKPPDLADPEVRREIARRYRELGACGGYAVFDLGERPKAARVVGDGP